MKILRIQLLFSAIIVLTVSQACKKSRTVDPELREVSGVIERVLPAYSDRFVLSKMDRENGLDVFEIFPHKGKIIIRGSSGVAICSGFNHYLKKVCNAIYNWRCGNNLNITGELPAGFEKIRKVSPYKYRYIFNYCTFSYSMAFWDWDQWERMIDWMAMNGINMPLAPMGQEIIWQRVYRKYGLSEEDLKDFFVGPAYNAFGRMGCIDGYGGPLPQSWISAENLLQKKILQRERLLGMTPVLQGFTGHIPPALPGKNPDLKYTKLTWLDFPATFLLDWEDPLFAQISEDFIAEQASEYGTDHLYAIDQFIEMQPARGDTAFLKNMSSTIYSSLNHADPEGKWVIQTWPFKETDFWNRERTKAYFDGVPDKRMIALELMGESWKYTGWYKHDEWYGKPWIWSIISNFGDNVSMFGGLPQITGNFGKALSDTVANKPQGLGLMMEGLDYNPVTYELMTDLMWEKNIPDLNKWKSEYLLSRYGHLNDTILKAWDNIFSYYYTKSGLFEVNPVIKRPYLVEEDIHLSDESLSAAGELMASAVFLKDDDAFRFDLVNLLRQVFGQYTGHLLYEITMSYHKKDLAGFNKYTEEFIDISRMIENLMATRNEFLFGKWVSDSRKHATNHEEEKLYEWNARAIITMWGGRILYGYAIKDWAGLYSSYYLPKWKKLFAEMRSEISGGRRLDYKKFMDELIRWEDAWVNLQSSDLQSEAEGNSVQLAGELWNKYGSELLLMSN
jgi:alpha-N-acetylglucosaminidase